MVIHMTFEQFCLEFASPDVIDIPTNSVEIPSRFNEQVNLLVANCRSQIQRAHNVKLTYIQNKLKDYDAISDILESKYNGEVDDQLMNGLSFAMFGVFYNFLSESAKAIIKTLTIYVMLQS